jgi:hypothetical protein
LPSQETKFWPREIIIIIIDKIVLDIQPPQGVEVSGTDFVPIFRVLFTAVKTETDELVACCVYCIVGHRFISFGFTSHQ